MAVGLVEIAVVKTKVALCWEFEVSVVVHEESMLKSLLLYVIFDITNTFQHSRIPLL